MFLCVSTDLSTRATNNPKLKKFNFFCLFFNEGFPYLAEHFNVLWKENWTLEAERVLKAFEKDVIKKVVISIT